MTEAGSIDHRGALEAVERILNRGGEAEDVLRAVLEALRARGVASAKVNVLEDGRVVKELTVGEEADRIVASIVYEGSEVGAVELATADPAFIERVATLISPYVVRVEAGGDAKEAQRRILG